MSGAIAVTGKGRDQEESRFAREGTIAHDMIQRWMEDGRIPMVEADIDTFEAVQTCVEHVSDILAGLREAEVLTEQTFRLQHLEPDGVPMFGSADIVIIGYQRHTNALVLHIVDYKHGIGIPVSAYLNKQLMYYGLGVLQQYPESVFDKIFLHIVQPRAMSKKTDGVSTYETSHGELARFEDEVRQAVDKIMTDPEYQPGEWCRFCPARGQCPVQAESAVKDIGIEELFEKVEQMPEDAQELEDKIKLLSDRDVKKYYFAIDAMRMFINALKAEAEARADEGKLKGVKFVAGRRRRMWNDEEAAAGVMVADFGIDDPYVRTIISPAQLEAQIGSERLEEIDFLIDFKTGTRILVRSTDPRPAIGSPVE